VNDFPDDRELPVSLRVPRDVATLAALAREVAMDINELDVVLARFELTAKEYAEIADNHVYKQMLTAAVQAWASAANTPERIRIEAASAFEQIMPVISLRMRNDREGLDDVVKGARLFAEVAGFAVNSGVANGERVTINIDLGNDKLTLSHEVRPIEPAASDRAVIEAAAAALPKRRAD